MPRATLRFHNDCFEYCCRVRKLHCFRDVASLSDAGDVISESRSTRVTRHQLSDDRGHSWDIHLKRFRYQITSKRSIWPRDKALVESRNCGLIKTCSSFGAPEVLMTAAQRSAMRLQESILITATIPNALSLEEAATDQVKRETPAFRSMLNELAAGLRGLHEIGFAHIDLQSRNILLQILNDNYRIYLIDSSRGGLHSSAIRRHHGRLRDLSSLLKSARQWMGPLAMFRWYKTYLGKSRINTTDRLLLRTLIADRALKDDDSGS